MSKERVIYLSRHGKTHQNVLADETGKFWMPEWRHVEGLSEITDEGKHQATILGQYTDAFILGREEIAPSDLIIVTSCKSRSMDTGRIVQRIAGIPEGNLHSYSTLDEQVAREHVEATLKDDPDNGKFLDTRKPKAVIGKETYETLEKVIGQHPEKVILATLHGNINAMFLQHAGILEPDIGNCSILPLHYNKGIFTVAGNYRTNEELDEELHVLDIFNVLERAAFQGKWNEAARNELMKVTGLEGENMAEKLNNPYDSRYQKLCVVSSILSAPSRRPEDYAPVADYIKRYPGSRKNLPAELAEHIRESETKWSRKRR